MSCVCMCVCTLCDRKCVFGVIAAMLLYAEIPPCWKAVNMKMVWYQVEHDLASSSDHAEG